MQQRADIHVPWEDIDTILLDMDGTLLDLYFDNYFWREHLPRKWGELHGLDVTTARSHLLAKIDGKAGTLAWYCLDHWSEELGVDILALKSDVVHLIGIRPSAEAFLKFVSALAQPVVMVTNAHAALIEMKMNKTGIDGYFDQIVSSHRLGVAKEEPGFWGKLAMELDYVPERSLLIDDNLQVLRSARAYGIKHLLTIAQPDSQRPVRVVDEFPAVFSYQDIYSERDKQKV